MYDMNAILAAMAEGKTADDLAKEFTDALNAANAKIEAEKAAKAKLAAERAKSAKVTAFKNIMIDIIDFVNTFYADQLPSDVITALNGEIKDETVADVVKEIDDLVKMAPMILALIKMEEKSTSKTNKIFKNSLKNPKLTIKNIGEEDANKIIHDFLSGLI